VKYNKDIVYFQVNWERIPKPFYVLRCDDHFLVAELDKNLNLINERSVIHWDRFLVRRWALAMAHKQNQLDNK